MIILKNERNELFQWDMGQSIVLLNETLPTEVHFQNINSTHALVVELIDNEAPIPNILLQEPFPIEIYLFYKNNNESHTIKRKTLAVIPRAQPADYIYTETEIFTYENILEVAQSALDGLLLKEDLLPIEPISPSTKFLNGNKEWSEIAVGAGSYAANLYFSASNSDINGYKRISYVPDELETIVTGTASNGETLLRAYLYDEPIGVSQIDAGVWTVTTQVKVSGTNRVSQLRVEAFLYDTNGAERILFSLTSPDINNTDYILLSMNSTQPIFSCNPTDRLGMKVYFSTTAAAVITVSNKIGDGGAAYFSTPLAIRHTQLRGLNDDLDHQHVTSEEKERWDGKQEAIVGASGSFIVDGKIITIENGIVTSII